MKPWLLLLEVESPITILPCCCRFVRSSLRWKQRYQCKPEALPPEQRVERPAPGSDDKKIEAAEQHRKVRACFVHHAPKARAPDVLRKVEYPHITPEEDRKLGLDDREDHDDD